MKMSRSEDNGMLGSPKEPKVQPISDQLSIRVTDNNNEIFFKIKRTMTLKKLMDAFCERQGKAPSLVRFSFNSSRVQPSDSANTVSRALCKNFFV